MAQPEFWQTWSHSLCFIESIFNCFRAFAEVLLLIWNQTCHHRGHQCGLRCSRDSVPLHHLLTQQSQTEKNLLMIQHTAKIMSRCHSSAVSLWQEGYIAGSVAGLWVKVPTLRRPEWGRNKQSENREKQTWEKKHKRNKTQVWHRKRSTVD